MADTVETPSATDQRNDPIVQDGGNAPVPENADVTESLFGETVTDAELMGEEPGTDTPEEPMDSSGTIHPSQQGSSGGRVHEA